MPVESSHDDRVLESLRNLEARIARIEARLSLGTSETSQEEAAEPPSTAEAEKKEEELEFEIGQAWFAKVGIVTLAIGIVFLLTFPYQNLPPVLPSLFGYVLVGIVVALSHYWRHSFALVSRYLLGGAMLLLSFTTLRLHFFTTQPVIADRLPLVGLLLLVVATNLFVADRRRSVYLIALSVTMGFATALIAPAPEILFSLVLVLAIVIAYFRVKYQWSGLLILGIVLSYLTHLLWAVNTPILGNPLQLVSAPEINLLFIVLYAVALATGEILRGKGAPEDFGLLVRSGLNGLGSYTLFLLLTLTTFKSGFSLHHLLVSTAFLCLSIVFWLRDGSKYATFVYAMLGYAALSIAIVGQFKAPDSFVWLSWQTVLVLSTAVWFRSRFIVVGNFVIYIVILTAYVVAAGRVGLVSLSFGVIALVSARILNWQKGRLELRTELMRNAYLACAFLIFPYTLYHAVPGGYVSLSWIGVAVFYYLASVLLKNKKYRWMSLLTLMLTVLYAFVFDLAKLEPAYRIMSFLVLGVVLVVISLAYTRAKSRRPSGEESIDKAGPS